MRTTVLVASAVWAIVQAGTAPAQEFPAKPVRILTSEAGGGSDVVLRIMAPHLNSRLGQSVIVENRGIVAPEAVAKAAPDGYSLLVYSAPLWITPMLRENVPWDVLRDFAPVTLGVNQPNVLVVHPSVPAQSVRELIALAKASPGKLNYGTGSSGSGSHLAGELFDSMNGIKTTRIPYKGSGPAVAGLLKGEVDFVFATGSTVSAQVKAGKLRALGVGTLKPSVLFPDMPTIAATVPGYDSVACMCVFAPAKTPQANIQKLNQAMVAVLNIDDVKKRVADTGAEVVGSSSEELGAYVRGEIARWGPLVKERGIKE